MSLGDTIRDHVVEHKDGMLFDLVFAIAWVLVATFAYRLLGAPKWVHYLLLASGVLAYFGFVWSLELAEQRQ